MKRGASPFDLFQDVSGFGGPDEGLGAVIVMVEVVEDGCDQLLDTAKDPATQAIFGQVAEESFHHVQPGAACGREVHAEAGIASEPALDLGMLVGGVVVR